MSELRLCQHLLTCPGPPNPVSQCYDCLLAHRIQSLEVRLLILSFSFPNPQHRRHWLPRLPNPPMAEIHPLRASTANRILPTCLLSRNPPSTNPPLPPSKPDAHPHLSTCPPLGILHTRESILCNHSRRVGKRYDKSVDTSQPDERYLPCSTGVLQLLPHLCPSSHLPRLLPRTSPLLSSLQRRILHGPRPRERFLH